MNYLAIRQEAENRILKVREVEVMIDKDVAELYGVGETAELNRKVKNNPQKFNSPIYCFDLSKEEKNQLIEQHPRLEGLKQSPNIKAYTEYGIIMLATTFHKSNEVATQVCHILVDTFFEYKKKQKGMALPKQNSSDILEKLNDISKDLKLLKNFAIVQHEKNNTYDEHLEIIFQELSKMKHKDEESRNQIGFKKDWIYFWSSFIKFPEIMKLLPLF